MSDDNAQTVWLQSSINENSIGRARQAIASTGRALPCQVTAVSGSIVTVSFEVMSPWTLPPITIPKAESQWMRSATQVGDFGMTVSADTFLGGISGQGSGVADTQKDYGNLCATLVFVPVAATSFPGRPGNVGLNRTWINGPNGAAIGDADHTSYTLHDGVGGTVSVVAPTHVSLGGLASVPGNVAAARAVAANGDLDTLINDATNGVIAKTLQTLAAAQGAAAIAAAAAAGGGTTTGFAANLSAIMSAAGWVHGLTGIKPTIPGCSSIVRVVS